MNRRDVALATRAEYIGGHPKLPHGRFVYLLLEGSLEAPVLTILLPSNQRGQPDIFPMSLLEVEKAKSLVVKLVNASAIIGHRLTFVNEYTGEAGRKHEVKLAHFFSGTDEVQDWENYIVCLQAEADTGKQPFGRWKSLPHASRKLAEPLTPSVTLPERDGRNNHPWLHRSE